MEEIKKGYNYSEINDKNFIYNTSKKKIFY